jgi:hypothetical protein
MLTTSPMQLGYLSDEDPHTDVGGFFGDVWDYTKDAVSSGIDFVSEVSSAITNVVQGDFDGAWRDVKDAGAAALRPTLTALKAGLKHLNENAYKIPTDPVNALAIAGALAACAGTAGAACGPALLAAAKVVAAREVGRVSKSAWDGLTNEGRRQFVGAMQRGGGKAFQLLTDNLSREAGKSPQIRAEAAKLARQRGDAAVSAQEMFVRLRTAEVWLRAQGVRSWGTAGDEGRAEVLRAHALNGEDAAWIQLRSVLGLQALSEAAPNVFDYDRHPAASRALVAWGDASGWRDPDAGRAAIEREVQRMLEDEVGALAPGLRESSPPRFRALVSAYTRAGGLQVETRAKAVQVVRTEVRQDESGPVVGTGGPSGANSSSSSSSSARKPNWVFEVPAVGGAPLLDVPRLDVLELELVKLQAGIRVRSSPTVLRMSCVRAIDVRVDALPPVPPGSPADALPPESAVPAAAPSTGP